MEFILNVRAPLEQTQRHRHANWPTLTTSATFCLLCQSIASLISFKEDNSIVCLYVCGGGGGSGAGCYPDLLWGWCHVQPDSGVNRKTEKMNTATDK